MKTRSVKFILIIMILIFTFVTGCSDSQFNSDYRSFKSSYMNITEVLDSKAPLTSIQKLNEEPILNELNELKTIALRMNKDAKTTHEKRIYGNVSRYYEGLEFLLYAARNKDSLSGEERGRVVSEITSVKMSRISIKQGDV